MNFLLLLLIGLVFQCSTPKYSTGHYRESAEIQSKTKNISLAGMDSIKKSQSQTQQQTVLIYTGSISIKSFRRDFATKLDKISEFVKEKKGYVQSQQMTSLTLKIPATEFKETLQFIRSLGEVSSEYIHVEDVSESYYDTKIRLENSENVQKRLLDLLNKSTKVSETIEVEKELTRVTEQIESLKGKLRMLQNRIDFSTLNVYLQEDSVPGPLGWLFYGLYKGMSWLFVWD